MVEEQDPSPEYIKGFNQAYKIEKDMPEVSRELLSAQAKGERFQGMVAGAKQYQDDKRLLKKDKLVKQQKILNQNYRQNRKRNR